MSDADDRREELRSKLAHSRNSLTAGPVPETDPPEGFVALAMEYPFAAIAGGLALGVLAGSLLPRSVGRNITRSAVSAAMAAATIGREYGKQAIESVGEVGSDGRQLLNEFGSAVAARGKSAVRTTEAQTRPARDLGYRLVGEAIKFASTLRH